MTHNVKSRREIPLTETVTSIITKKVKTINLVNGGKKAVCVELANGCIDWGFGDTWESAEINAVENASKI